MPWFGWVLVWVVVLAATAAVFFLLGRRLFRQAMALFDELGTASRRLEIVREELQTLADRSAEPPAVFADPVALRQERYLAGRRKARKRSR